MLGLDYILAGYVTLASNQIKCQMTTAPEITVSAKGLDRGIDQTKTIRQLNAFKPLTKPSPYKDDTKTYIQGLAKGGVSMSGEYEFSGQTYPSLSQGCLYVSKVHIQITLDSTIFIAREYPTGSCFYNAVLQHELKHKAVDRELVNKYSVIIVRAINNTLKIIGYEQGPFDVSQRDAVQKRVTTQVEGVITQFAKNFSVERQSRQSQVDTLEEYNRVHALCQGWPNPSL